MNLILDFDSTIIRAEGLDVLAEMSLRDKPSVIEEIQSLTNSGMSGDLTMHDSLSKRLGLLSANRIHVWEAVEHLRDLVSPSFKNFLERNATPVENIYVVSGGFMDYVVPVCTTLGLLSRNIFANQFIYQDDEILGFSMENPLSKSMGKSELIASLNLSNPIYMVGDGYTDLEVKLHGGLIDYFIAYTETTKREPVVSQADYVCSNFIEVLNIIENGKAT